VQHMRDISSESGTSQWPTMIASISVEEWQ
jgi:hypothetical protein